MEVHNIYIISPWSINLEKFKTFWFFNLKIAFYSKLSSDMFNTFYLIENKHSNHFFFKRVIE